MKFLSRRLVLVAVAIVVAAIAGLALRQGGADRTQVRLGAALPLTGPYAQYGTVPRNGIELAIAQRRAEGYSRNIVVQYEDTELKPNLALTAARKLIEVDRVPVIIGAAGSNETEVIAPIAQKSGVVIISPSSTAASLSKIGDYFFRTIPTDAHEGTFMARYVYGRGVKSVGILAVNDTGTKSLADSFKDEFVKLGGAIGGYALAPKDTNDLRTQIAALRSFGVDAAFVVGYGNETGVFLRQARELGLTLPLYSAHPAEAPEVRQIAGAAADGLVFSTPAPAKDSAAAKKFAAAYRAKYGIDPGEFAAEAYDAAMLVMDAIQAVGLQASSIRDYLHKVRNYDGASGAISFSASGDVEKPINVMTIRAGAVVPFDGK